LGLKYLLSVPESSHTDVKITVNTHELHKIKPNHLAFLAVSLLVETNSTGYNHCKQQTTNQPTNQDSSTCKAE
jgi:hypothetical protein